MSTLLFNEIDPFVAAWLRNLWPDATVMERSISDVQPADLAQFSLVHLFAGIGGWERALQLAGWPADKPVWTGSCPCQPFSQAGKQQAEADKRHLWPEFRRLIAECRPATIFGEQVASRLGRAWLAGVRADLEALGYAVGAADLCAASIGAPHIRQRLWWVADSEGREPGESSASILGYGSAPVPTGSPRGVGDASLRGVGALNRKSITGDGEEIKNRGSGLSGFWSAYDLIPCADGKSRRIEPGTFPLAHGVPGRVGLLRAYGNAIVPQVAAVFIRAFLESEA